MEHFINQFYSSPICVVVITVLTFSLSVLLFSPIAEYHEKDELRKEIDLLKNKVKLLKRDLSYCKQFMSEKDLKRYKLHRQFDIELEGFLKENRIIESGKWCK